MAQQDWSRRTSGISMHGAEGSERASMASRATFMGDGGASFLGAPPGGGSRSSVAVPGARACLLGSRLDPECFHSWVWCLVLAGSYTCSACKASAVHQHPHLVEYITGLPPPHSLPLLAGYRQHAAPALSASEAAAEALRRKKAEEQRALARLPGLEPSLRQLEQALAQNSYHTLVARGKGVQLCRGASVEPTAAAEGDVPGAEQGFAAVAAAEGGGSESATAVTQPRMTAPGGALEDGKGPPVAGAAGAAWGPQELWHWKCEAAQDLPVSCIAWNKVWGWLEWGWSGREEKCPCLACSCPAALQCCRGSLASNAQQPPSQAHWGEAWALLRAAHHLQNRHRLFCRPALTCWLLGMGTWSTRHQPRAWWPSTPSRTLGRRCGSWRRPAE